MNVMRFITEEMVKDLDYNGTETKSRITILPLRFGDWYLYVAALLPPMTLAVCVYVVTDILFVN